MKLTIKNLSDMANNFEEYAKKIRLFIEKSKKFHINPSNVKVNNQSFSDFTSDVYDNVCNFYYYEP